jgi:hypothetical protein
MKFQRPPVSLPDTRDDNHSFGVMLTGSMTTPNSDISYQAHPLINTAALARCDDALSTGQLFQQFVSLRKAVENGSLVPTRFSPG